MEKIFDKSILLASGLLLLAGSALAMPTAGQYVRIDTVGGAGNANGGGEFLIDVGTKSGGTYSYDGVVDYISFCLEIGEHIDYAVSFANSPNYYIESVSDDVVSGGNGGNGSYDTLSDDTQWVFYNYMYTDYFDEYFKVTLGYDSNVMANYIQEIIWYLEGEKDTLTTGANSLYTSKILGKTNDSYNDYVTAINLRYSSATGTQAQSQLIADKAPVPEPTTMLLFGTGIAGLAGIARRKRD